MWLPAVLLGLLAVATGVLPLHEALAVTARVAPVLAFLIGITVVAELADEAEVFDVAAIRAARLGGGSARRLFLIVVALGILTTVVLSLDTTAVLLTPVVLALAQRLSLPTLPFAMAAVWLANTSSLLLPVSNLTNLLAVDRLDLTAVGFAARMAVPALAAVVTTTAVLAVRYRRELAVTYTVPPPVRPVDSVLLRVAATVCLLVAPLFLAGLPVAVVALVGALVLVAVFGVRRPKALRVGLVPWRLVLLVEGLFLVVTAAGNLFLDPALRAAAGTSGSALGVIREAVVGAAASNAANNLPAYIALERAVPQGHEAQLLGLLIGTDVGPLVLLWGSLATLLWRERCRARGVHVGAGEFARLGLVGVPLVLLASVAGLLLGPAG